MQSLTNVAGFPSAPVLQRQNTLDLANEQIRNGRIAGALDELIEDLQQRRDEDREKWPAYARECASHPIAHLLHQDPFTCRAFSKPRGYAGDAVMMDLIYSMGETTEAVRNTTPLGRAIFQHLGTHPGPRAVRYRRALIAGLVDDVAVCGGSSVLAIASGHLREVESSHALRIGRIERYVALDQDEASLEVVGRDYGPLGVETMPGSVRQILAGKIRPGEFDFVYAAGLFDYLNQPVAAALTSRMFEMIKPGGLLLIPNFLRGLRDVGYMESFMDWHLIYRDHAEMRALADTLPAGMVTGTRIFDDPDQAITFLLVRKSRVA